jgi:hypothetical protein
MKVITATPGSPTPEDCAYTAGLVRALGVSAQIWCALVVKLWKIDTLSHSDVVEMLNGLNSSAEAIGDDDPAHADYREALLEIVSLCRRSLLEEPTERRPGGMIGGESAWPEGGSG